MMAIMILNELNQRCVGAIGVEFKFITMSL